MEYTIKDVEGTFNGEIVQNLGNNEFVIKLNDREQTLKIISMDSKGIEFVLSQKSPPFKTFFIKNKISIYFGSYAYRVIHTLFSTVITDIYILLFSIKYRVSLNSNAISTH